MYYSTKRQQFLVDQGYSFKVISEFPEVAAAPNIPYREKSDQLSLLADVRSRSFDSSSSRDKQPEDEDDIRNIIEIERQQNKRSSSQIKRTTGKMSALSGGKGRQYSVYDRSTSTKTHPLFQRLKK
jgi:DNA excision repair protein ERCC-3